MSAPADVLAVPFGEMPEPRGYAWSLNNGDTEYTHDPYCPVEPEEWSIASALYDADQCREFARAAVAELIEENARIARHLEESVAFIEKSYPDARHLDRGPVLRNMSRWAKRLRVALARVGGSQKEACHHG